MEAVRVLFPLSQLHSWLCLDGVGTMGVGTKASSHWQRLIPREGHGSDTTDRTICTYIPTLPAGPPGMWLCPIPFRSVKEISFIGCQQKETRGRRLKSSRLLFKGLGGRQRRSGSLCQDKRRLVTVLLLPKILSVV